jgi:hypothetical protein
VDVVFMLVLSSVSVLAVVLFVVLVLSSVSMLSVLLFTVLSGPGAWPLLSSPPEEAAPP